MPAERKIVIVAGDEIPHNGGGHVATDVVPVDYPREAPGTDVVVVRAVILARPEGLPRFLRRGSAESPGVVSA